MIYNNRNKRRNNHSTYARFRVVGRHLDDGHAEVASDAERNEETCSEKVHCEPIL